jgi:hypothetical protein
MKIVTSTLRASLLTLFAALAFQAGAQTESSPTYSQKAVISQEMKLEIPAADHLPYAYEIDITSLNFKDAQTARDYFRGVSDNLVHFEANEEGTSVTMRLQYQNLGSREWSREDWNNYLASKQDRMKNNLQRMND